MSNLVGVSGKIGSGKDTVGKIIQFLTNPFDQGRGLKFEIQDNYKYGSPWQIKKYADKLKDIVCILLGCTREDLENREFKEKELGQEWWYWKSEDDDLDLIPYEYFTGTLPYRLIKLTPRLMLQLLGTDCGRKIIHPNLWINALFVDYKESLSDGWIPTYNNPDNHNLEKSAEPEYPHWCITDVRFPDEAEAIESRGGFVIRINRLNSTPQTICVPNNERTHPSETALDNYTFKYTIDNNGSIEELIQKVKEILIKEGIING